MKGRRRLDRDLPPDRGVQAVERVAPLDPEVVGEIRVGAHQHILARLLGEWNAISESILRLTGKDK